MASLQQSASLGFDEQKFFCEKILVFCARTRIETLDCQANRIQLNTNGAGRRLIVMTEGGERYEQSV
jgi:hypothetical protein